MDAPLIPSEPLVAVQWAQARLEAAAVQSPRVDAELLLCHVLEAKRSELLLASALTDEQRAAYKRLVELRAQRRPLQHLTGEAYFRYLSLHVGPGVFIPRPETEHLVDLAIAELATRQQDLPRASSERLVVADLCAGSGAIGLSIATEVAAVDVSAVELSADALSWLRRNHDSASAAIAAQGSLFRVVAGDATSAAELLVDRIGTVDVLTCNPPYIPDRAIPRDPEVRDYDPPMALYGGVDGLDVVRGIVEQAALLLRRGGLLLIEHSDQQGDEAGALSVPGVLRADRRFDEIRDSLDLTGRPRVTVARRAV